jgi:hypothetical protein
LRKLEVAFNGTVSFELFWVEDHVEVQDITSRKWVSVECNDPNAGLKPKRAMVNTDLIESFYLGDPT